ARSLCALALFLVFSGLLIGSSRGAIGAVLVMLPVMGIAWLPKSRRPLQIIAVALIGIALIGIAGNFGVVEKQRRGLAANDPLSHRDTIWRRALVVTEIYPVFGAGMGNFGKVGDSAIAAQVAADGDTYETAHYLGANHAHNLYLNTLAERGLVGAGVFIGALLACLIMLLRRRPRAGDDAFLWSAWGASLAAWGIVAMAGMFNTSFHHEIALLAVLPLGAWISMIRGAEV
ncbi:MAG TPA: O-antigen ligase family protein, partial [Rhodocyclaceae bacterium]